jgi:perosamine synthetase
MLLKNRTRFLSLYFSSIGWKQSLHLFSSILILPFINKDKSRSQFHGSFSKKFKKHSCYSYSSGRASLAACLKASGIEKGDEVLLSSFTCLAVPTAVVALGAVPKYCDIDPVTLNIDPNLIKQHISNKTRAIVVQHTLGSIACVNSIKDLLADRDVLIIEDCALSLGSAQNQRLIGTSADATIFSLELSKTISSGWGGVLLVNNEELEENVRNDYKNTKEIRLSKSLRMAFQTAFCGILYSPNVYFLGKFVVALFFKLRLFGASTPECELEGTVESDFISKLPKVLLPLAREQIERFDEITSNHKVNSIRIIKKLHELNYSVLGEYLEDNYSVSPRVPFLVKERKVFVDFFMTRGIEVGSWFDGPLSPLPEKQNFNYIAANYPKASFVACHIVNLPCHARLKSNDLVLIEDTLKDFSKKFSDQVIF